MRIFIAHNYYQQPGGEDLCFAAEADLLESQGHTVYRYSVHNDSIGGMRPIELASATLWNRDTYQKLRTLFRQEHFDIAHFHNTFPLISPAAYHAAQDADIPVIQTLHNYRLICPSATFFRNGHVCEDCIGKAIPWPGVRYRCYRDSRLQTAAVAAMLTFHRTIKTWLTTVNQYIALTEFSRQKFIEAGFSPDKVIVKPNFLLEDPCVSSDSGDYMIFVGRLVPEKGVMTMLEAWRSLPNIPLKIIGDGPLREEIHAFIQKHRLDHVEMVGQVDTETALQMMKRARFLIFPSAWYEGFPRVLVEALACGVPIVTAKLGSQGSIVEDGRTGLHFMPGDENDLAAKVKQAWNQSDMMNTMRHAVRQEYERKYTAESNYHSLMKIYADVIRQRSYT